MFHPKQKKGYGIFFGLVIGAISVAALIPNMVQAAPTLLVGNVSAQAGSEVDIPVQFDPDAASVAGIQFDLTLPKVLTAGPVTAGTILNTAGKNVGSNQIGQKLRLLVFGVNQNTIQKGMLLTVHVKVASGTRGSLRLPISGIVFTDPDAHSISPGKSNKGTIQLVS